MFERLPTRVSVVEVSPRDGLQNEVKQVPTQRKLELIHALAQSGLQRIEATSFVSPRWVPQLADAGELMRVLMQSPPPGARFSALCPNATGLERARAAGLREVALFLSASETHNQRNTNRSIQRSLDVFEELIPVARDFGMRVRVYLSTVWGCPYEGEVDMQSSLSIARSVVRWGAYQVSLGDTIGVATPLQTKRVCEAFLAEFEPDQIALHLHDTRGTALSNVLVGLDLGVATFDASIGGLGGCPYAPGASGNLATEDLVYMLHGMGIETGVDLPRLLEASALAEQIVGRALPSKMHQAGLPKRRS